MGGGGAAEQEEVGARTYRRRQPEVTLLYAAVRENLASLVAEADQHGRGLPRYVARDFSKYLDCGQLANGFARVRCEKCHDELRVAFSCKGRGVCPSCNAKPSTPDGGAPRRARPAARALAAVDAVLSLRAAAGARARRAAALGRADAVPAHPLRTATAACTPPGHARGQGGRRHLRAALRQRASADSALPCVGARRRLHRGGRLRAAAAALARGGGAAAGAGAPPRQQPRCAFLEGFSLHANTHLHENDRGGLERLCRYGARGPLALERFERMPDGRIAYRMKRPLPGGRTHLHFTGLELLRKLTALVPPPRSNLVRFHGVFAPGAKLRAAVAPVPVSAPAAPGDEAAAVHVAPVPAASGKRTPRLDWAGLLRRTFALDVFLCTRCGGKRRVLAYLTSPPVVRAILAHVGEATQVAPLAAAQGPSGWE